MAECRSRSQRRGQGMVNDGQVMRRCQNLRLLSSGPGPMDTRVISNELGTVIINTHPSEGSTIIVRRTQHNNTVTQDYESE